MKLIYENTLFAPLRDRYNNLIRKENFENLSFSDRFCEANELMQKLQSSDYYQYRREMDLFSFNSVEGQSQNGNLHVNLATNDYLDFTHHPAIIEAGIEYIMKNGTGSGRVPMLAGTFAIHKQLENRVAAFIGYPGAITFNSGYSANFGLLTSILTSRDVAILDTHVHASIIDGCSNTNVIYFSHNDCQSLQLALKKATGYQNKFIVVDGIYSMGGDCAPLKSIIDIARNANALVMIDESHAIGVMGNKGKGTQDYFNLVEKADIVTGSLGKALGGIGGYVAGTPGLISLLELNCRAFIFSASIPPAVAASLDKAFELLESGDKSFQGLWQNIIFLKTGLQQIGFDTGHSVSAIIPLRIRDEEKIINLARILFENKIAVNPVFYPVVPKKASLIRVSVSAGLTPLQMEFALNQLELHGKLLGIL